MKELTHRFTKTNGIGMHLAGCYKYDDYLRCLPVQAGATADKHPANLLLVKKT